MESDSVGELFPLFSTALPETIESFLSVSEKQNYAPKTLLIDKEDWGKEVVFIVSGWVNVCALSREQEITLDILADGDYFGEIAVLDDFPPFTRVIALSDVQLLKISAQRFLQMVLKDPQLQHRILQITIQKVRHLYRRLKSSSQSPERILIKTLMDLAKKYGRTTNQGIEIFKVPTQCFASMIGVEVIEIETMLIKLHQNKLLEINNDNQTLSLPSLKQLQHFSKQL
jgi:hypothetical protein